MDKNDTRRFVECFNSQTEKSTSHRARKIQELQDKYEDLYDSIPMGYLTLDNNNIILEANLTFAEMVGLARPNLVGTCFINYIVPDSREIYFLHIKKGVETRTRQICELRLKRNDGSIFNVRLEGILARGPVLNQSPCHVVITDITQQKQIEELIHYQANLVDNVSEAIISTDQSFIIRSWNKGAENVYGYTSEETVGKNFNTVLCPEPQGDHNENITQRLVKFGYLHIEDVHYHKDGQKLNVVCNINLLYDEKGQQSGTVWVIRDVTDRRHIEVALQLSEQRYRNLVETTSDIIWEVNSQGLYTYISPRIYDILGYTPEEILGKTPFELMDTQEAERVRTAFMLFASQEMPFDSLENTNHHKSGRDVVLETSGIPFHNADGTFGGYRGIDRDITERKRLEMALARSREELELRVSERTAELQKANEELKLRATILDMAYDAILLYSPDGGLLYANEAASKLYGYSRDELGQFEVTQLIPPGKIAAYESRIEKVLELGKISAEVYHQRKDGELIPVETHSQYVEAKGRQYIISIIRDITQRKQAEEQLKQNEKQLQSILDALTEGVALISTDGRIIKANMAEAKVAGVKSPEDRVGKYFRNPEWKHMYTNGTPLPIEDTALITAINRKCSVRNLEMGLVKDNGSTTWLNINAVPIIKESGELMGVVRTLTDITEQKRLRDEREQFTRKLLDVQEEERKRISRELHDDTAQYLALITLEMDSLINNREQLPENILSRLKKLRVITGKALQEVRRFSHELRPSVLEHFGLTAALELIVSEFSTASKTEVTLDINGLEIRLPDEAELAFFRIAQEAISNIRKHSQATKAKVGLKFATDKVNLTIADNGKGFDMREKTQINERSSLGLIGMRERAHLIGAGLHIKSTPNRGTVVTVELRL